MGVKSNVQGISIAPLKSALAYADDELGITVASSSYAEICDALLAYFPDFDGKWLYDGVYSDNFGAVTTSGSITYSKGTSFTATVPSNGGSATCTVRLNNAGSFDTLKVTNSINRLGTTTSGSISLLDSSGTVISTQSMGTSATTHSFDMSGLSQSQKEFVFIRYSLTTTGQYTATATTTQIIGG